MQYGKYLYLSFVSIKGKLGIILVYKLATSFQLSDKFIVAFVNSAKTHTIDM